MKIDEKSVCSFPNWYPKLQKWSIKSECVVIPDEVLAYLSSDGGVVVPSEAVVAAKSSDIDRITHTDWNSDNESESEVEPPTFPEFSDQLKEAMRRLGGHVFVKLNWSAPTDAAWIATNNCLKVSNLQDLYLLLKSSDKISDDLTSSADTLVLKKWTDIHPGSEFRCFVTDSELTAISQRSPEFHVHIQHSKHYIVTSLRDFFQLRLKETLPLTRYIFDVIWEPNRIRIVDLNAFHGSEPYLFTSEELQTIRFVEGISPEFRFIGEDTGIQPMNMGEHFGIPKEMRDISNEKSQSVIDMLIAECQQKSEES